MDVITQTPWFCRLVFANTEQARPVILWSIVTQKTSFFSDFLKKVENDFLVGSQDYGEGVF